MINMNLVRPPPYVELFLPKIYQHSTECSEINQIKNVLLSKLPHASFRCCTASVIKKIAPN